MDSNFKNKFYQLGFANLANEVLLRMDCDYDDKGLKVGEFSFENLPIVSVSDGDKFFDVLRFQDPFNFAISEKFYNLLKNNNLTGWNSYDVIIKSCDKKYYGFQVLGQCDQLLRPSEIGFTKGYDFDYNSWDGSDFFCPKQTLLVFCTEKVKKILIDNDITNVTLTDVKNINWYNAIKC